MDEKRQVQKELFEEFARPDKKKTPKNLFQVKTKRSIDISYEQIVAVLIGVIILAVIFFSLGVEKGKSVSAKKLEALTKVSEQAPNKASLRMGQAPLVKKEEIVVEEEVVSGEEKVLPVSEDFKGYTVQVASYVKKETAQKEADRLKDKGFDAFVFLKGKYYVLCIGEFRDKEEAETERQILRRKYKDCLIREIS